jgi:glycine/D-amino acid oxidase-like deaminating enzyme
VTDGREYRGLSLWLDTVDDDLSPRPPLDGDARVDVAIVGAGFTGLWTAYALLRQAPQLRVLVVERDIAGFGASGRNGGWASDLFPVSWERVARVGGSRDAAIALHRALVGGIDDIEATLARESIDADFLRGGALVVARTPLQAAELRERASASQQLAGSDLGLRWLERDEVDGRVQVGGALGATYTPHCARLHPARLVRGLARAVERLGGEVVEGTAVTHLGPHRVHTTRGTISAGTVVRATEAFTPLLRGERRRLLPLYSLVIATEPLSDATWSEIGWAGAEALTDGRHLIIYAQRTADGRIVFGGRGAPYHYGSRVSAAFDREPAVFEALETALHDVFPATRGVAVTHRWGGAVAAARDWFPSVGIDRRRGVAWAGGYVGDGVTASNVAGRTIADLILERATPLTGLAWVQHHSRRWEPEPLRWLGVNAGVAAMRGADAAERRTGRPSLRARVALRVQGY